MNKNTIIETVSQQVKRIYESKKPLSANLIRLSILTLSGLALSSALADSNSNNSSAPELIEGSGIHPVVIEVDRENQRSIDERWAIIKKAVLGDVEIGSGEDLFALIAPGRAFDGSSVPVAIEALTPQTETNYIKQLYLFADKNPAPLAGKFVFKPDTGWKKVETRIRINEYTTVRAVAETNDGKLHMVDSYIKASGGCSAAPLTDQSELFKDLGAVKFKVSEPIDDDLMSLKLRINHPNNSGMQFDQISRNYIPAYFIHTIGIKRDDEEIIKLETNFSLSENPTLQVSFAKDADSENLQIYAVDSKSKTYSAETKL